MNKCLLIGIVGIVLVSSALAQVSVRLYATRNSSCIYDPKDEKNWNQFIDNYNIYQGGTVNSRLYTETMIQQGFQYGVGIKWGAEGRLVDFVNNNGLVDFNVHKGCQKTHFVTKEEPKSYVYLNVTVLGSRDSLIA